MFVIPAGELPESVFQAYDKKLKSHTKLLQTLTTYDAAVLNISLTVLSFRYAELIKEELPKLPEEENITRIEAPGQIVAANFGVIYVRIGQ